MKVIKKYVPTDLSGFDTDQLSKLIEHRIETALSQFYAPLTDKNASGKVDPVVISEIHRLIAELTSRFLLMKV